MKAEHRELLESVRPARRVLVVDDHPSFRRCARGCSRRRGSRSSARPRTGRPRSPSLPSSSPELVLLDIQLPDIDGFEVAVAAARARPGLAIVLVSSRDRTQYGSLIESSGARGFVAKDDLSGAEHREVARMTDQASPAVVPDAVESCARRTPAAAGAAAPLALAATALVATGGAVYMTAVSRHAPNPAGHASLRRSSACRSSAPASSRCAGRRMCASGCCSPPSASRRCSARFHDANGAIPYTIGVLTSNLVFALARARAARLPEWAPRFAVEPPPRRSRPTSTCLRCRRSRCSSTRSRAGTATIRATSLWSTRTRRSRPHSRSSKRRLRSASPSRSAAVLSRRVRAATRR